jgi:hypothetical protein
VSCLAVPVLGSFLTAVRAGCRTEPKDLPMTDQGSHAPQEKNAEPATAAANAGVRDQLAFGDRQDFADASRGAGGGRSCRRGD